MEQRLSFIITTRGHRFDFLDPYSSVIDIRDIAHALANACRFTGHSRKFYSVAEHSVFVSYLVEPGFEFEALMHDAHEAYVGDMATPLKQLCPDYKVVARRVDLAIRFAFGLATNEPPEVKAADAHALKIERTYLVPDHPAWPAQPCGAKPACMPPAEAEGRFLARFMELRPAA